MDTRRILVVEDDSAIRQGIVDALKFAGYEVLQAANGNDGIAQGLRATIDLLMLDLVLPGPSGFDILKAVRDISILQNEPTEEVDDASPDADTTCEGAELQPQCGEGEALLPPKAPISTEASPPRSD